MLWQIDSVAIDIFNNALYETEIEKKIIPISDNNEGDKEFTMANKKVNIHF